MKEKELSELPFETALGELEQIVRTMEAGELSLDDMIAKFEQGTKLSDVCKQKLEKLEKKIEVLVNNNGKAEWQDFKPVNHRVNEKQQPISKPAEVANETTKKQDDYKEPENEDLLF